MFMCITHCVRCFCPWKESFFNPLVSGAHKLLGSIFINQSITEYTGANEVFQISFLSSGPCNIHPDLVCCFGWHLHCAHTLCTVHCPLCTVNCASPCQGARTPCTVCLCHSVDAQHPPMLGACTLRAIPLCCVDARIARCSYRAYHMLHVSHVAHTVPTALTRTVRIAHCPYPAYHTRYLPASCRCSTTHLTEPQLGASSPPVTVGNTIFLSFDAFCLSFMLVFVQF